MLGLAVAGHDDADDGQRAENGSNLEGAAVQVTVGPGSQQMKGADSQDEEGGGGQPAGENVGELGPDVGVKDQGEEIGHLGTAVDNLISYRLLHKGIGNQNPQRRKIG